MLSTHSPLHSAAVDTLNFVARLSSARQTFLGTRSARTKPSKRTRKTLAQPRPILPSSSAFAPLSSRYQTRLMSSDDGAPQLTVDQQLVASAIDEGDNLSVAVEKGGRFYNPWTTWEKPGLMKALKWQMTKETAPLPSKDELDDKLPVHTPDWPRILNPPAGEVQTTWMGHASFLVQIDGLNILTDPVWSDRCSPVQFLGPSRYRKPPCHLMELPRINVILISHNHYDHLDLHTVRHFKDTVLWIVPHGHRKWFADEGITRVIEMKWWDKYPLNEQVEIACLPAQHWSKRTAFDDMCALWSGWAILGSTRKVFFAGDTGLCPGFKEIGDKFGPFDLSLIPIGAYEPRWMMRCQHVDPVGAVDIHVDIQSKQSIGMHWGTWVLTDEHVLEPPQKVAEELAKRNLDPASFIAIHHGTTFDTGSGLNKCTPFIPIPETAETFETVEDVAEANNASSSTVVEKPPRNR